LAFFFPSKFFFFWDLTVFLSGLILVFFSLHLNHHFVWGGTPTYPSNLPTTFPPTSPSTYLSPCTEPAHLPPSFCSPLFCACALLHHQRLRFKGTKV
jgi:hypothetical protein